MEKLVADEAFWRGKRVLVTGHTGFKGSWLCLWLRQLGAEVTGYSLPPPTRPSLFEMARVAEGIHSIVGDITDAPALFRAFEQARPDIVFHLAAQSLVRHGYANPVETYNTNVMGTVQVLEACRATPSVRAAVIVTTDKCYENREWVWGYRENDPMGGRDPYSSSKGCAELVTAAYRESFFRSSRPAQIATVRAGNVIGGGDWAVDRLVPDLMRAFISGQASIIRNPGALRPWQHVLEPLGGYLQLATRLWLEPGRHDSGWNFGPDDADTRPAGWIADRLVAQWGEGAAWMHDASVQPHEANLLKLDSSKAHAQLGWRPRLRLETALSWVVDWYRAHHRGDDLRAVTQDQIRRYSILEMETQ